MGGEGLKRASQMAILNANYIARAWKSTTRCSIRAATAWWRTNASSRSAPAQDSSGISVDDVAKRLIDFGFHARPCRSPVAGTLMIEPTESESRKNWTASATP